MKHSVYTPKSTNEWRRITAPGLIWGRGSRRLDVYYLKLGVAPSGERLQRKGRHGVICR